MELAMDLPIDAVRALATTGVVGALIDLTDR